MPNKTTEFILLHALINIFVHSFGSEQTSKVKKKSNWVVVTDEKMSKNVTQDVFSFMMDAELLVKWMR